MPHRHGRRSKAGLGPAIIAAFLACLGDASGEERATPPDMQELRTFAWPGSFPASVITAFEDRFEVKVRQNFFESETVLERVLAIRDGQGFDVIVTSGFGIPIYQRRGWLVPVTEQDVPNLVHVAPRWRTAYPGAEVCLPFQWGTTGIVYRRDLVPEPLTRWSQFFNLRGAAFRRRLIVPDDSVELVGFALKALGYSYNATEPAALDAAERLLVAFQPSIHSSFIPSLEEDSVLVTGAAIAAILYNGDAQALLGHSEDLVFTIPQEGTELWVDYLCIMKASRQPSLAATFLNFLQEPAIAAETSRSTLYAPTNRAAEALLPDSFLQNPGIYPPEAVIEASEFAWLTFDLRSMQSRNEIHSRVLGSGIAPE